MRSALCALVLVASAALAAPPPLDIPAEIAAEPGDWVTVAPKTTAKSVVYVGLDRIKPFPSDQLKDGRNLVLSVPANAAPGTRFRFVAVGTLGDEQTARPFAVVVGGADPGPPPVPPAPDPKPKPDPKPAPAGPFWLIVVEETGDRTPETAAVLGDSAYWLALRAKGHKFRFYDKDSADAKDKGYGKAVGDTTLPALLILGADGAKVNAVPLPKSTAGIDALIGGAK
jgi:hypothetical protein